MKKLSARYGDGCLVIQRADYIEDGWYIAHDTGSTLWALYEIPVGGGEVSRIGNYPNVGEALSNAENLT